MKTRGKQFKKRSTGQRGPEVGNAHVCSVVSDSFATAWTAAHQAPLSMGFSRQEYWGGLPFLLQGIFLTKRLKLSTLCLLHCGGILYSSANGEALGAECQKLYVLSFHLCSRGKRNVSYPTKATFQFTLIVKMGNKMLIL